MSKEFLGKMQVSNAEYEVYLRSAKLILTISGTAA